VIELVAACLGVGLVLAIVAVLVLAVTLPRRVARLVARLVAEEQAKSRAQAIAVRASAAELASIVEAARRLLTEHAQLLIGEHGQIVGTVRALAEWLAERANAHYAQASALAAADVETQRKPGAPPPVSRERPSPAPRGMASDASQIAAGLGPRPVSRTLPSMTSPAQSTPRAVRPVEVAGGGRQPSRAPAPPDLAGAPVRLPTPAGEGGPR
jgi:Na+-transporting methylmalonyl-CoA/oxaloacetate decarboxylase gamma subunit